MCGSALEQCLKKLRSKILKNSRFRLHDIYAHIFLKHFSKFTEVNPNLHLNSSWKISLFVFKLPKTASLRLHMFSSYHAQWLNFFFFSLAHMNYPENPLMSGTRPQIPLSNFNQTECSVIRESNFPYRLRRKATN